MTAAEFKPCASPACSACQEVRRLRAEQAAGGSGAVSARVCPTQEPEPHLLGEFPMTCYRCHIEADS